MRPGKLKRRIEIKRPSMTTDDEGGQTVIFTSLGIFWADVRRVPGARSLEYDQTSSSRPFEITIRQNIDILEDDQVEFEGMVLVVSSVDRDWDKFRYQRLTAAAKYNG